MHHSPRVVQCTNNQPIVDTAQYDRFARKGSFNSATSNSLNSSIGSGSRPVRQLINLNYPAAPHLTGSQLSRPLPSPLRLNVPDEPYISKLPASPRRGQSTSLNPDSTKASQTSSDCNNKHYIPPKTAPLCGFQDSAFNENSLCTVLQSRNGVKRQSINFPSISPPLTNKH